MQIVKERFLLYFMQVQLLVKFTDLSFSQYQSSFNVPLTLRLIFGTLIINLLVQCNFTLDLFRLFLQILNFLLNWCERIAQQLNFSICLRRNLLEVCGHSFNMFGSCVKLLNHSIHVDHICFKLRNRPKTLTLRCFQLNYLFHQQLLFSQVSISGIIAAA